MIKLRAIWVLVTFLLITINSQLLSQDLNTILSNHYEAIGQNVRSQIRSVLLEINETDENNNEKKYSIIKKKPNKIRIEGLWEGQNYISAFDGIRAWTIAPWTGVAIPQLMTFDEIDEIISKDGIDSPIYAFQQAGDEIEYIGTRQIDEKSCYLLKINSIEKPPMDYYLSTDTYLIYKSVRYDRTDTTKIREEVIYKNYEAQNIPGQGNFSMSKLIEVKRPNESVELVIDEIIIGFGAPNSFFTKPE